MSTLEPAPVLPLTGSAASPPAPAGRNETPLESLSSICTVLAVGLFILAFVFQNFEIPSGSMLNTLLIGDHVLAEKITFAPPDAWARFVHYRDVRRGDVIVFFKPHSETPDLYLVKRAIGLPGDHIRLQDGVVYVNGVAQKEPFALGPRDDGNPVHALDSYRDQFPSVSTNGQTQTTAVWAEDLPNHIQNGDLVVPPGKVFAMGDNRTESRDSRYWGFVPRENIIARPLLVYWSFQTPADQMYKQTLSERLSFMLHTVTHLFTQTRWSRTLHLIR